MTGARPQQRPVDPKTGRLFRIVSPAHRFPPPPRAIRKARLDNLVLVPANLLPLKGQYQAIANQQAPGTTLVVLPAADSLPRRKPRQSLGYKYVLLRWQDDALSGP